MDTTEIPTPQPGCDGDPLTSITERWADLLGCTKSMCALMRAFNSSIDIGYAPMGLGEQVWAELTTLGNLVDAARISITPAIVASGRWKTEGSKSPEDWLAGKTGSSTGKARTQLETGKNLRKAPGTQESFLNGEISAEQADTIADAVEANPAAEDDLLEKAKRDSLKNLKDEAARRKAEVEDIEERERRLHRKRYVRQWTDKEGAWNLRARGPIPTGSEFMAVLEGLIDQQFKKARKTGVRGTRDNYAYDALMDLANQHGWGHGTGNSGGDTGPGGSGGGSSDGTDGGSGDMGGASGPGGYGSGTGPSNSGRASGDIAPGGSASCQPPSDEPTTGEPGSGPPTDRGPMSKGQASAGSPTTDIPTPGSATSGASGSSGTTPARESSNDSGPADRAQRSSSRAGTALGDSGSSRITDPFEPIENASGAAKGRPFDLERIDENSGGASKPERRAPAKLEPVTGKQVNAAKQRIFCIDWTALVRGRIHPGERCELRGVGMVSVRAIRQALRASTARMVVTDANDRVITVALIGTGSINGRLFPMGSGKQLPLDAPDAAELTVAEASPMSGPSTVIVRVQLADLGALPTASDLSTPCGTSGRTVDLPGVGPIDQRRFTDLLGDELARRLVARGTGIRAITHAGRAPSAAQRVALAWADTTCKVPGCHNQRVEIDHRTPWAADRVTELDNLDPLCGHHHDLKTHHGWAFAATDSNLFVGPDEPGHPRQHPGNRTSRGKRAG